jgi:hypothetical protein
MPQTEQWFWAGNGSQDMILFALTHRRPVVLAAQIDHGGNGVRLVTCDRESGLLVPLEPDHLVARLIQRAPESAEVLLEARRFIFENTEDGRKDVQALFVRIDQVLHGLDSARPESTPQEEGSDQWTE